MKYFRDHTTVGSLGALLSWALLLSGCMQTSRSTMGTRSHNETVAFTTLSDRTDAIDVATSVLVESNFSITLANDRIGLLQTDFVALSSVRAAMEDTLAVPPGLNETLMRISVNVNDNGESQFVRLKGTFQMTPGARRDLEPLVSLYWLERVAEKVADGLKVEYKQQLSDSTYAEVVSGMQSTGSRAKKGGLGQALGVVGISIAILFAVTLAISIFSPGNNRTIPTQGQ
jgi:hypothetical protein